MGVKLSHPDSKITLNSFVRDILEVEERNMSKSTQSESERCLVGRYTISKPHCNTREVLIHNLSSKELVARRLLVSKPIMIRTKFVHAVRFHILKPRLYVYFSSQTSRSILMRSALPISRLPVVGAKQQHSVIKIGQEETLRLLTLLPLLLL
jgi:hypothetical protein